MELLGLDDRLVLAIGKQFLAPARLEPGADLEAAGRAAADGYVKQMRVEVKPRAPTHPQPAAPKSRTQPPGLDC